MKKLVVGLTFTMWLCDILFTLMTEISLFKGSIRPYQLEEGLSFLRREAQFGVVKSIERSVVFIVQAWTYVARGCEKVGR